MARTWAELTHPDDLAEDVANFERVMRREIDGYKMDKRYLRKDGQIVYATIDVRCIRDGAGNVDFFVATIADITGRKQEAAARAADEDRYLRQRNALIGLSTGEALFVRTATGGLPEDHGNGCQDAGRVAGQPVAL